MPFHYYTKPIPLKGNIPPPPPKPTSQSPKVCVEVYTLLCSYTLPYVLWLCDSAHGIAYLNMFAQEGELPHNTERSLDLVYTYTYVYVYMDVCVYIYIYIYIYILESRARFALAQFSLKDSLGRPFESPKIAYGASVADDCL